MGVLMIAGGYLLTEPYEPPQVALLVLPNKK